MNYGSVLRTFRKSSNISQEELAHALHMSQSNVSKIENDVKEPLFSVVMQWVQYTGTQDAMAAIVCGVDVAIVLADMLPTVLGMMLWH